MDFWQKARTFAEEAAKKSQELTMEAAKRSQEFTMEAAKRSQEFTMEAAKRSQDITIGSSKLSEIVSEASKRSKEIAAEASKRADQIKVEASKRADQIKVDVLKRADQIKSQIPAAALSSLVDASAEASAAPVEPVDLEKFGITDELREFVKGITMNTFRDFPLQDDAELSEIPAVSNVRQDLTAWQETHAKLVLSTVKEISKLRYELCPRVMKERKFWRIYFILVNSHVAPYESRYMDEVKLKLAEQVSDAIKENVTSQTTSVPDAPSKPLKSKTSTSEQDLDVFLLGDLGDSDDGPDDGSDDGDKDFDDDFDKI